MSLLFWWNGALGLEPGQRVLQVLLQKSGSEESALQFLKE